MFRIKKLSELTGIKKYVIRFYEREGLFEPSHDRIKNFRYYSDHDVITLSLIRYLRIGGFKIRQIKSLFKSMELKNDSYREAILSIIEGKMESLEYIAGRLNKLANRGN